MTDNYAYTETLWGVLPIALVRSTLARCRVCGASSDQVAIVVEPHNDDGAAVCIACSRLHESGP